MVLQSLEKDTFNAGLSLESPEQPIPVKKQAKYNITRWALTGRNDLWLNTMCYNLYLRTRESNLVENWKKLCFLWSSDLRTHITNRRWEALLEEIKVFANHLNMHTKALNELVETKNTTDGMQDSIVCTQQFKKIENSHLQLVLNLSKGCAIHSYKSSDFDDSIIGTIEHGYFEDIEHGADFFSGHTTIDQLGKHKITDLTNCIPQLITKDKSQIIVTDCISGEVRFEKKIILNQDTLKFSNRISLPIREKQIIHPFHFTFNPEAWDKNSLYFATHNGGNEMEIFHINNKVLHHGDNLSFLISARHGLGNTKGIVEIGDRDKTVTFKLDLAKSFLIPFIFYKNVDGDKFLFRLVYSAQEIDETFKLGRGTIIDSQIEIKILNNHI